ncbi:hypothetical protein H3C66_02445 [Patescibacteria group bacterium]|nr:hypothetical protein [Patescibacteria group bacterium]
MSETPRQVSPADIISRQRREREARYLERPDVMNERVREQIEKFVVLPIVEKLKRVKAQPVERQVTHEKSEEGRVGFLPRFEKTRLFKGLLRGERVTPLKVETTTEEHTVEDIAPPAEEVHIKLFLDATPELLLAPERIRRMMEMIIGVSELDNHVFNTHQQVTEVKKVSLTVYILQSTVDGHRVVKLGTNLSTQQLMEGYMRQLKSTVTHVADEERTVFSLSQKILDVSSVSHQLLNAEKQEPNVVFGHTLVMDHGSDSGIKPRYSTATPYSVVFV